ncbi:hypothetical protein [Sphingobium chlorophenolicum]|uniref:Uncharacterized protein n=1 Tax=Sphingobium chlorophenolicum TaxID=46429 RepID=A0A081RJE6_SPHCR|nr:hypothetical protein [Sphingobium chlorophenolicum]KEQ55319.1 hypothetical protein BV95_00482 [Sphingobium chlorophenolicum]
MKRKPAKRQRFELLKALALFLFISLAVDSLRAQAAANPPEVQKALEVAASRVRGRDDGTVKVVDAVIGDHSLEIRYQPSAGVERAVAAEKAKSTAATWAKAMCASDSIPDFLRRTGTKLAVTFETTPGVYEVQSSVDANSCPHIGTTPIRYIKKMPLYAKPSKEAAEILIDSYLRANLRDYDSAKVRCGELSGAVRVTYMYFKKIYGYLKQCDVNAKNGYGGYTGFQSRWYYFNGPDFLEFETDPQPRPIEE